MWYLGELIEIKQAYEIDSTANARFIFAQELDTGLYKDITSVETIHRIGRQFNDYCFIRQVLSEQMEGSPNPFWSLSDAEKEIIAKYCATDEITLVTYYMMQGMSQFEATKAYIYERSVDVRNAADCYYARLTSPSFTASIMLYLGPVQGETFVDAIRNFASDVKDIARVGTNYGNINDGILDYIESTGSYVNGGLKNYTITPGLTLAGLIKELKDIFYHGYTT